MIPRILIFVLAALILASCAGAPAVTGPAPMKGGDEQITNGNAAYGKGCYAAAIDFFYRAYEMFSVSDQPLGVAMSLNNMGNAYRALGKPEDALALFEEAQLLYSESSDQAGLRQVLSNKAAALMDLGMLDEAEKALNQAERTSLPGQPVFLPAVVNRGVLLTRRGDLHASRKVLDAATAAAPGSASAHYAMGALLMQSGHLREAEKYFQAALKADQAAGFYAGLADDLQKLGDVHLRLNDTSAALNYWKRSVRIYALLGLTRETDIVMDKLRTEAAKSGAKLDVVEAFVQRYKKDKSPGALCD
jgi:tetratricopeptide (TPR) repeat protein